jgi:hypothetical protein
MQQLWVLLGTAQAHLAGGDDAGRELYSEQALRADAMYSAWLAGIEPAQIPTASLSWRRSTLRRGARRAIAKILPDYSRALATGDDEKAASMAGDLQSAVTAIESVTPVRRGATHAR